MALNLTKFKELQNSKMKNTSTILEFNTTNNSSDSNFTANITEYKNSTSTNSTNYADIVTAAILATGAAALAGIATYSFFSRPDAVDTTTDEDDNDDDDNGDEDGGGTPEVINTMHLRTKNVDVSPTKSKRSPTKEKSPSKTKGGRKHSDDHESDDNNDGAPESSLKLSFEIEVESNKDSYEQAEDNSHSYSDYATAAAAIGVLVFTASNLEFDTMGSSLGTLAGAMPHFSHTMLETF